MTCVLIKRGHLDIEKGVHIWTASGDSREYHMKADEWNSACMGQGIPR